MGILLQSVTSISNHRVSYRCGVLKSTSRERVKEKTSAYGSVKMHFDSIVNSLLEKLEMRLPDFVSGNLRGLTLLVKKQL